MQLDDQGMADFYENKYDPKDILINQYVFLRNMNNEIVRKYRWTGDKFEELKYIKFDEFAPITDKQQCAFDLLSNPDIPIKILAGCAGSGKTRLCMTFGLHYVMRKRYERFFVVRHNVSVGEKNGYLPGNKFEKILGWLGFFKDNLEEFAQYTVEELYSRGTLDVDSPEFMKGRDIKNSWLLIDECEDLTEEQFKMLGERASSGTTICFVGDYDQTTEEKYKKNCGLKRALRTLPGNKNVGVVVFDDKENDNVRSEVSKIFTSVY